MCVQICAEFGKHKTIRNETLQLHVRLVFCASACVHHQNTFSIFAFKRPSHSTHKAENVCFLALSESDLQLIEMNAETMQWIFVIRLEFIDPFSVATIPQYIRFWQCSSINPDLFSIIT